MGLLNFFSRSSALDPLRLPRGSFTMDRDGRIVASTLPQSFPKTRAQEIGQAFLSTFRSAQDANISLTELMVDYAAFRLTARELRGGAIVFLAPHEATSKSPG